MAKFRYDISEIHDMEIRAGKYYADRYDDAYETLFYEATRRMIVNMAICKDAKMLKVLEIGCGPGNLTKFFSGKQNCNVVAVDISFDMLQVARRKIRDVHFLVSLAERLPFKDNSFDAVVGYSVLHHLPDLVELFDEVIRILKPDGFFIFGEPIESFLDKNKILFRLLKIPVYPLYLFFKKKNYKNLEVFKEIDFDAFLTPIHRHLAEKEIISVLKNNPRKISLQLKRLGILSPWFGAVLFKSKQIDIFVFRFLWYIDLVLSRLFFKWASEGFIKGRVKKEIYFNGRTADRARILG